jgi:hypothetical protein
MGHAIELLSAKMALKNGIKYLSKTQTTPGPVGLNL